MNEQPRNNLSREERLAAQLRANLRRRKAQSKAMSRGISGVPGDSAPQTLPNSDEGS